MKKNIRNVLIGILFVLSYNCTSYKSTMHKGVKGIEYARMNVITDFVNTYNTPRSYLKEREGKPFDVFWIFEKQITGNLYVFSVSPEIDENITLSIKDSLGKVPNSYFPNKYEVKKGKLFVWKDSITPLRKNVLDIVNDFGVLDSVDVKRELGLLPKDYEDTRVVTMDHRLKSVHYYVCKNNIAKYKRIVTNEAIENYDVTKLKCSKP